MKILIPTNDGLTIAPDFEKAKGFRFLTMINGVIQEDVIRTPEPVTKDPSYEQVVIIRGILPETEKNLRILDHEVLHTQETNIFNALFAYVKDHATTESNYCCCP